MHPWINLLYFLNFDFIYISHVWLHDRVKSSFLISTYMTIFVFYGIENVTLVISVHLLTVKRVFFAGFLFSRFSRSDSHPRKLKTAKSANGLRIGKYHNAESYLTTFYQFIFLSIAKTGDYYVNYCFYMENCHFKVCTTT